MCHLLLVQEVRLEIVDLLNLGVNRNLLSRGEPEGRYDKDADCNLGFHRLILHPREIDAGPAHELSPIGCIEETFSPFLAPKRVIF